MSNKNEFQCEREKAELIVNLINEKIVDLGNKTSILYDKLVMIQRQFDAIRNVPSDKQFVIENVKKVVSNWKTQTEEIEKEYNDMTFKSAGVGAAGVSAGVAVVAFGPTVAMGVATTFGVASTGTAISALSGAAATNAALAWLGGGALSIGGGGMAAGNVLLAMAGPIGWTIAGVSALLSGLFIWKTISEKKRIEELLLLTTKRDNKKYSLAHHELNEKIDTVINYIDLLQNAIENIENFGLNYNLMSEKQQYRLGAYVNFMNASSTLLITPIKNLQQDYNENDFERFMKNRDCQDINYDKYQNIIISLANMFYKIDVEENDKKIIWNFIKGNEDYIKQFNIGKNDFKYYFIEDVFGALERKYLLEK